MPPPGPPCGIPAPGPRPRSGPAPGPPPRGISGPRPPGPPRAPSPPRPPRCAKAMESGSSRTTTNVDHARFLRHMIGYSPLLDSKRADSVKRPNLSLLVLHASHFYRRQVGYFPIVEQSIDRLPRECVVVHPPQDVGLRQRTPICRCAGRFDNPVITVAAPLTFPDAAVGFEGPGMNRTGRGIDAKDLRAAQSEVFFLDAEFDVDELLALRP